MYKVGDEVLFTFLGEEYIGVIIDKVDRVKWKVQCSNGTVYPFIYGKQPIKKRGSKLEIPLGIIIKKLTK